MRSQQSAPTTLTRLFLHHVEQFDRERLLSFAGPCGPAAYSTRQFSQAVFALRRFLLDSGLKTGDRVAIMSGNRPEWHIADFAILLAGGVVVPIYTGLAPSQVTYLVEHGGCRAAIVSGSQQWEVLGLLKIPRLEQVIAMTAGEGGVIATATLPEIIDKTPAATPAEWESLRAEAVAVTPDTLASIVYTSGTTGTPKGVMLSHGNFMFDVEQCLERLQFRTCPQALSVLPLAHVFERLLCYGYFRSGIPLAYGDPHALRDLLRQHKPSVMGCVPRVMEKIKEAVEQQVRAEAPRKQQIFSALLKAGLACTSRGKVAASPSIRDRLLFALAKATLLPRIRRQLGGLEYVICGGAWLNPAVEKFFRAVGISVLQGYGLTETSPVICLNGYQKERTGSVGPPLNGVEVRVDENGEILTRGPHVMKAYYRDPEGTAATISDGWLRTGDLGSMDEEGYLEITGRVKELMVLSTGKNVCPGSAEQAIQRSPFVQNAYAVGDGRRFLAALIVPHLGNLESHARQARILYGSMEELLQTPEIQSLFRDELIRLQSDLSPFERVKRFAFLREEVLLDPELVTPTQKVRRKVLEKRCIEYIEGMYSPEESPAALTPSRLSVTADAGEPRGPGITGTARASK